MRCESRPNLESLHRSFRALISACSCRCRAAYTRQAGDTSEIDVEKVEELLQERNFLRRNREFDAADEVRNKLNDMGVRVLDREQEWFVWRKRRPMGAPRDFGPLGHDYTRANDDKSELSEEVLGEINELLRKRLEAKMSRRCLASGARAGGAGGRGEWWEAVSRGRRARGSSSHSPARLTRCLAHARADSRRRTATTAS